MKNYLLFVAQEGAVGIDNVSRYNTYYGKKMTTETINATGDVLFVNGAEKVYIFDYKKNSLDLSVLDGRLVVLDETEVQNQLSLGEIDMGMIIGANAKNGTSNAFMCYTHNPVSWHEYSINGESTGFIGIVARYLGYHNVPLGLVAGDEAACLEVKDILPNVQTVATKTAMSRNLAKCISMEEYKKLIKQAVQSMQEGGVPAPIKTAFPATLRLISNRTDFADETIFWNYGTVKRVDGLTCEKVLEEVEKFTSFIY